MLGLLVRLESLSIALLHKALGVIMVLSYTDRLSKLHSILQGITCTIELQYPRVI